MGRIDYDNEWSDAQVVTTTAVSTSVIDLNDYPQFIGGEDMHLAVTVGVKFAGGTSIQPILQAAAVAAMTSAVAIHTPPATITASATAGATLLRINLSNLVGVQRYLRLNYVVVGTMSGGGTVNAALEITPEVRGITLA